MSSEFVEPPRCPGFPSKVRSYRGTLVREVPFFCGSSVCSTATTALRCSLAMTKAETHPPGGKLVRSLWPEENKPDGKQYIMKHIMSEVSAPHNTFSETMDSLTESWTPEVSNLYEELANEYRLEVQIRQRVARQVHDARQSAALTQAELSRLSGLPQPEISRIERGFANPTLTTLTKLATALQSSFQIDPLEEAHIKHPGSTTRNSVFPPSSS